MLLDKDILRRAGQFLFAVSYADVVENAGGRFPSGCEINDYTPPAPEDQILPLMAYWQATLEGAWGFPLWRIFNVMGGLTDGQQVDFLYYAVMGCVGHGVGLWDDWAGELDKASLILGKQLAITPCHLDSCLMDQIADDFLVKHGLGQLATV